MKCQEVPGTISLLEAKTSAEVFSRQGGVRTAEEATSGNGNSRCKGQEERESTGCLHSNQQCMVRSQNAVGKETGSVLQEAD